MNTVNSGNGVLEITTEQKQFPIPPEGESITGTVAGVKDLGYATVTYKGKTKKIRKVAFKFYLDALDPETGENITSYASYNASLHEKSGLTKLIKSLTGKDVANSTFNVMSLIGITAQFVFEHNVSKSNGKVYANIASIIRMKNQKPFPVPADFVAFKDKDTDELPEGVTRIEDEPTPSKLAVTKI